MYYLLVNQDVESSLKLSDLSYEMTDMGGYDKPLEEFKKQYVKEAIQKSKEEKARMKQEYREAVALENSRLNKKNVHQFFQKNQSFLLLTHLLMR